MAQVAVHLPKKPKTMSSNPSATKKNPKIHFGLEVWLNTCLEVRNSEFKSQCHPPQAK
jgi:hypothetical protein